jgi:hypothetical protein
MKTKAIFLLIILLFIITCIAKIYVRNYEKEKEYKLYKRIDKIEQWQNAVEKNGINIK